MEPAVGDHRVEVLILGRYISFYTFGLREQNMFLQVLIGTFWFAKLHRYKTEKNPKISTVGASCIRHRIEGQTFDGKVFYTFAESEYLLAFLFVLEKVLEIRNKKCKEQFF